jgi:hypothetical protein
MAYNFVADQSTFILVPKGSRYGLQTIYIEIELAKDTL